MSMDRTPSLSCFVIKQIQFAKNSNLVSMFSVTKPCLVLLLQLPLPYSSAVHSLKVNVNGYSPSKHVNIRVLEGAVSSVTQLAGNNRECRKPDRSPPSKVGRNGKGRLSAVIAVLLAISAGRVSK